MICNAEHIEQPYSGEYTEKIYDIKNPWNSSDWTWIKFTEENSVWCGEFRGRYRGVAVSERLGIIVVLTSDYMYVLDINTADIIEYDSQPDYVDITTSPYGDIFVTDGYGIEMFTNSKVSDLEVIIVPVNPDNLRFEKWNDNILKISCYDFYTYENVELYFDSLMMEWVDNL